MPPAAASPPAPDIEREAPDLLLADRDWVAREFKAIIAASAIRLGTLVGTLPREQHSRPVARRQSRNASRHPVIKPHARVRSPPCD